MNLPTGTVTFLFTDIEGSIQLWEQHPKTMQDALAQHDALLQAAIMENGGLVVKTTGDGVLAVFATAPEAVAAAVTAQRQLLAQAWDESIGQLRVRMGMHSGTAELRDGDYYGPTVNRAARIQDVGHGGQILLSQAAQSLVVSQLPPDVTFIDLGSHHIGDIPYPEHIYQLCAPDLSGKFPPLRSLSGPGSNLPAHPTPFVGRELLLQTKLYMPPKRPSLVPRPHLIKKLNAGLNGKLTLISAPAGFGKTTLVSEWVRNLRLDAAKESQIVNKITWLSLDDSDNDPTRFLTYFIAALNQVEGIGASIGEGALVMLQSPQPPPSEDVLTSLVNDITAIPDRIILVLDDYHSIVSSPVDDAITFLLEHLPPQMHLVIATRDDPQLHLARLRARGQLAELRATDLRFTSSEATEFLTQVMGLNLSKDDISVLENRTEGWIAGLQLAAISMQGSKDAAGFIKSFTGSHRFVLDYLIEEVLEQQSESIQTFLLQTAVLNRLTGPLCDALTGQKDGQAYLETLERANLFIVSLDEERRWYRYHHLFSDLLRKRLRQKQPDWVPTLHIRASEWYMQNGFVDEAIEHTLRAEDFEWAAHLIDEHFDALWTRGEHAKLRRWLGELPVELVFSKPQLCIFHALYLFTGGQQAAAESSLRAAEQALEPNTDRPSETSPPEQEDRLSDTDRMKLRGRLEAVRAFISSHKGDIPGIIQHARQALQYLPEQDLTMRSMVAIALGDAHAFKGEMEAAYQAQLEALAVSRAAGNIYFLIVANLKVAVTLREQGHFQRTIEICQQQMQLAVKSGLSQAGVVGWLLAIWGEALAELNDLDGAIDMVGKGVALFEGGGNKSMLGWSYLCLMRVLCSKGDITGAEEIIQKAENIGRETDMPPWFTNQIAAWQARLWLAQNKLEPASQWARVRGLVAAGELRPLPEIDYFWLIEYVVLARILIAQGWVDETAKLLQRLLESAETGERTTRVIEILILQAMVSQSVGDTSEAVVTLEQALTLAEPGGFVRIFVDEGPTMARLLHEALNHGIAPDYVCRMLAAFPVAESEITDPSKSQDPQTELFEPLSERELEVLQLIAEGLTNPEIATRLFLSVNTVKAHTRNIYGKLDSHNRMQAVTNARAFGILSGI
ncbi:MAG: LuxR C-terminal-related transcriptional regulator [Candidatus Promineifilaceae bacterium]